MITTEQKRRARIYRTAAERIATKRDRFSCYAIANAELGYTGLDLGSFLNEEHNEQSALAQAWPEAVGGVDGEGCLRSWMILSFFGCAGGREARDFRVLLLCFAAAMAETGDI